MAGRMYAVQTAAFESARSYGVSRETSNPDEPPSRPLDIVAACKHKQEIVTNLPKQCSHCKAALQPDYVQELNGDIYAYCKGKDGCGKSQMLFVGPQDYLSRTYAKVCVFKPKDSVDPPLIATAGGDDAEDQKHHRVEVALEPRTEMMANPPPLMETLLRAPPHPYPPIMETAAMPPFGMLPTLSEMVESPVDAAGVPSAVPPFGMLPTLSEMVESPVDAAGVPSAVPPEMFSETMIPPTLPPCETRAAPPPMSEMPAELSAFRAARVRPAVAPVYEASAVCATCEKPYSEHNHNADRHGWVLVSTEQLQEPADWPVYQSPGVWKNRDQL